MSKEGDTESETIRWPTNLDRAAIEKRLAQVGTKAAALGVPDIGERFAKVRGMPAAQIASGVVASLAWLGNLPSPERARYAEITRDLEMVALNLKNLK